MDSYLAGLPFLRGLLPADLERTSRAFILRRYAQGEAVFSQGSAPFAAFLLRSGLVKAMKGSPRAVPVILEIVVPGRLFGLMAALDRRPYPVDAVCLQDSEVYRVRVEDFAELMRRHAPFAEAVYAEVGDNLRRSQDLRAMAKEPADRRIGHILWMLSGVMGPRLSLGRADIARMAGTTAATAIRVLGRLRAKRLIDARWKRIEILKPAALRDGAF